MELPPDLPPSALLAKLREAFPAASIGLLPKPLDKNGRKELCDKCHSYHAMPAAHIEYVGHAAVTDRLLSVDPGWNWQPLAFDAIGLPVYDQQGGLWIKLTVLGLTRLGYGDGATPKERISDALRNAAMRFGVALDMWAKGDLPSEAKASADKPKPPSPPDDLATRKAAALATLEANLGKEKAEALKSEIIRQNPTNAARLTALEAAAALYAPQAAATS